MGQYQYNERDDMNFSANKLRQEMEERIRQEEYQRYLAEIDRDVKHNDIYGPASKMLERTIRREIMSDDIARGVREVALVGGLVGSIAGGIALCIASGASDAAYNNAMERAMKDYESERSEQVNRFVDEGMSKQVQSLGELNERVAEKRQELEYGQNAAYVEYRETRQEAQQTISDARDAYNARKEEIAQASKAATENNKQQITTVVQEYKKEIDRIKSEYPEGPQRNEELQKANERRAESMQRIAHDYHLTQVDLQFHTKMAEHDFNSVVEKQKEVITQAQTKMDNSIAEARAGLSNAETQLASFQANMYSRDDMNRSVMEAIHQGHSGNFDNMHNAVVHNATGTFGEIRAASAAIAGGSMAEAAAHARVAMSNAMFNNGSSAEERFAQTIMSNHKDIGLAIAQQFGTKEERDLLSKCASFEKELNAYKVEKDRAAREGLPEPPKPKSPVSEADVAKANAIVSKYSGSMDSEKDMMQSISMMRKSANELTAQNDRIQLANVAANKELANLNNKAANVEKQLAQLTADHKLLERGKTADGVKLTDAQRKELMARIGNANVQDLQKQLLDIKTKQKGINNDIAKNNNLIAQNNKLITAIDRHTNRLEKNGKAILQTARRSQPVTLFGGILKDDKGGALIKLKYKDKNGNLHYITKKAKNPNKAANDMQKKGINKIFNSVSKISREVKKEMNKGNAFQNELMKNARSMSNFARKYDLAIGIGSTAIRMLGKVGKPLGNGMMKAGKNIFKKIGGNNATRLGNMMKGLSQNAKFQKFVKVGKIAGNSGKAIGGKLLKAPSAILKAPMKLMNAPQELAKGAAKVAWRTTRKVTGVTVRGAKKVTKKALKATVGKTRFGKKISSVFSSAKNKLNAFKQSLSKLNPMKFLKKKLAGLISTLTSALTSVLSFCGTILLYVLGAIAGFAGIVIVVIILASLLLSIINAIFNWLKSLGAEYDTYVINNPNYILNQAVNYRYEELQILESIEGGGLVPSVDPIEFNKMGWWMFGAVDITSLRGSSDLNNLAYDPSLADVLLTSYNEGAYKGVAAIGKTFKTYYNNLSFTTFLRQYDKANISYYPYDAYTDGSLSGDTPSLYEISNAKDVLAMVDTLYQDADEDASENDDDKKRMQVHEVLAYLGIGDYRQRIKYKDDDIPTYKENLFWRTHKLVYKSGTSTNQIKYHTTKKSSSDENSYIVNSSYIYSRNADGTFKKYADGSYQTSYTSSLACDNSHQETITLKYDEVTYTSPHRTQSQYNWTYRDEYPMYTIANLDVIDGVKTNATKLTPSQLFYYSHSLDYLLTTYPTYGTSGGTGVGIKNNQGTELTINTTYYGTNYKTATELATLKGMLDDASSDCRVTFYRQSGTSFRVVDSSGYYLGTYNIRGSDSGHLLNMITQYTVGSTTYTFNTASNSWDGTNLEAFFITWDASESKFNFKVIAAPYKSGVSVQSRLKDAINIDSNGTQCSFLLPYFSGVDMVASCDCEKIRNAEEKTLYYTYCTGHLDLEVGVIVTTIDDGDALFKAAREMRTFPKWKKSDNEGFLGIVIYSNDDYASGWGSYTLRTFNPSNDWKSDSKLIEVARSKAAVDHEYEVEDDEESISKVRGQAYTIDGAKAFKVLDNRTIQLLLRFNNQSYYVYSFTSGEQVGLSADNGNGVKSKYDIRIYGDKGKFEPHVGD